VIKIGDDYHAVCGNGPIGCRDLILTEYEAALLTTDEIDKRNCCLTSG
jgi:hypothetical protein